MLSSSTHIATFAAVYFSTRGSGVLFRPFGTKADDEMPPEDLVGLSSYKGRKAKNSTGYPAISGFTSSVYHPKEAHYRHPRLAITRSSGPMRVVEICARDARSRYHWLQVH